MAFSRNFDGKSKLDELERGCESLQKVRKANLLSIQGRNAELDDGTKLTVNVAQFEPKDRRRDVHDDLKMVKKDDADVAFRSQMAAEGRAQIGGDMNVFIENQAVAILVFGKSTTN